MKKSLKFSLIIIAVLFILAAEVLLFLSAARPVTSAQDQYTVRIKVPAGMTVRSIAENLKSEKLIRSSIVFYIAARYPFINRLVTGNSGSFELKSGVYRISSSMNLARIFDLLSSGQQEFIRVAFPEGLTVSKIAARLENAEVCNAEEFKLAVRDAKLLEEYNIPAESFEGYLFPDTYFFTPSMDCSDVIRLMADNFFDHIKQIPALADVNPVELNNTVILASIVEREYRVDEEAPLIASVFKNRVAHNIGLYSCATIEYIITEINGRPHPDVITYDDLNADSPYNTYKWAGLTPGPISNPGIIALEAAASPAKTDYYYFRLVDPATGRHAFSRNFSTHISEGYIYNTKKASGN